MTISLRGQDVELSSARLLCSTAFNHLSEPFARSSQIFAYLNESSTLYCCLQVCTNANESQLLFRTQSSFQDSRLLQLFHLFADRNNTNSFKHFIIVKPPLIFLKKLLNKPCTILFVVPLHTPIFKNIEVNFSQGFSSLQGQIAPRSTPRCKIVTISLFIFVLTGAQSTRGFFAHT